MGLPRGDVAEVARLIEATKHDGDSVIPLGGDAAWLRDFDLSILGADRDTYARYASAIRREYAVYPDEVYGRGRRGALKGFQMRPQIFLVPELRDRWDAGARRNIAWELSHDAAAD